MVARSTSKRKILLLLLAISLTVAFTFLYNWLLSPKNGEEDPDPPYNPYLPRPSKCKPEEVFREGCPCTNCGPLPYGVDATWYLQPEPECTCSLSFKL